MKRTAALAGITASLLLITACGGNGAVEKAEVPRSSHDLPAAVTSEAPADPTEPVVNRSDRGNIIKKLGEEGGIFDAAHEDLVMSFTVDAITPITCTEEYAVAPENGQMFAVDLRMATTAEMAEQDWAGYYSISNGDFQFVGPDGITNTNIATRSTYGCLSDGEMFPSTTISPGSQYIGKIVLDLPASSGTLIYIAGGGGPGWEWTF
jgi:hypothetical protein